MRVMSVMITVRVVWLSAALIFLSMPAAGQPVNKFVYQVITTRGGKTFVQSGFKLAGVQGIVTSLHGVVGASYIKLEDYRGVLYPDTDKYPAVGIVRVSTENDLAVLSWPGFEKLLATNAGLDSRTSVLTAEEPLTAWGFPNGICWEKTGLQVESQIVSPFEEVVPDDLKRGAARRNSPMPSSPVVRINGSLSPGYSGAPVFDGKGRVVAVGSGGLKGGSIGISWGIPIKAVGEMRAYSATDPAITQIISNSSDLLFAAQQSGRSNSYVVSRISAGVKYDRNFQWTQGHNQLNGGNGFSLFLLGHFRAYKLGPWFADRLGLGYSHYLDRDFTAVNTFTTLKDYRGFIQSDYTIRRYRLFGRYYVNGTYDSYRLFTPYVGVGFNVISQRPDKEEEYLEAGSESFVAIRDVHQPKVPDFFAGFRFAKQWYSLDLELSYLRYKIETDNYIFNVFGNATPDSQKDWINDLSLSFAVHINFPMMYEE